MLGLQVNASGLVNSPRPNILWDPQLCPTVALDTNAPRAMSASAWDLRSKQDPGKVRTWCAGTRDHRHRFLGVRPAAQLIMIASTYGWFTEMDPLDDNPTAQSAPSVIRQETTRVVRRLFPHVLGGLCRVGMQHVKQHHDRTPVLNCPRKYEKRN